jgi:general secretion pathway protein L
MRVPVLPVGAGVGYGRAFLGWWWGELAGLVPRALIRRVAGNRAMLVIRFDGARLYFGSHERAAVDSATLPAALLRRVQQAESVALELPASMVLRRAIDLPAAATRELAAAVPFLAERHTPFPPGQARVAWRVVGAASTPGRIQLELAATDAAGLARLEARLHQLGIPIAAIHVAGDGQAPKLDFAAGGFFGHGRRLLAEPWRVLLAATLCLILAGPIAVAITVHLRAAAMGQALASRGAQPQDAQRQEQHLRLDEADARKLGERLAAPDVLGVLDHITDALPDTSWLFSFDYTPTSVQIGGFSTDMPDAVGRLQALRELEQLEFRSPVIHDAHADRDRFDILLHLKKGVYAGRVLP